MSNLKIEKQITNDSAIIEFIGSIDEDFDYSGLESLNQKKYIFDFKQVAMINSCGIREWINFINKLDAAAEIVYKDCPQIVIEQMNMVHGFLKAGASIDSFYAPYFCEKCDKEEKIFLSSADISDGKAPSQKCKDCGAELEFDDIEEQYFAFLKR